ncbi:CYTH domain-containing protein [Roseobacteraceae bacterium NS-SX3]
MQEIERKFLVAEMPDLAGARREEVQQGYLTQEGDSTELRLRRKGGTCYLTLKGGEGTVRSERECEIAGAQFETFWPETAGRRLEKTRWTGALPCGLTFELDVFKGALAPLVLLEVEFESLGQARAFQPPAWFGREVTDERQYRNRVLAAAGPPAG